jgi:hypothetical protein
MFKKNEVVVIIGVFFFVVGVAVVAYFASELNNSAPVVSHSVTATPANTPILAAPIQTMPTARQIAAHLHCDHFKDLGSGGVIPSVDSGSCWIGAQKYAINTFETKQIRNAWLEAAEPLGVTPKWTTANAVIYKSVTT